MAKIKCKRNHLEERVPEICPIDNETECIHNDIKECRGCDKVCNDDDWKEHGHA